MEAWRYSSSRSMLFAWRKAMEAGAATRLHAEEPLVPASEVQQLKAQIRELKGMLARKTQEAEILKEAVEIIREKTPVARTLAEEGKFPVKAIVRALVVSR